jgi:hypothetical protein
MCNSHGLQNRCVFTTAHGIFKMPIAICVMHYVCCIIYTLSIAVVAVKSIIVVSSIFNHRYIKGFRQTRGCEPILQNPC